MPTRSLRTGKTKKKISKSNYLIKSSFLVNRLVSVSSIK